MIYRVCLLLVYLVASQLPAAAQNDESPRSYLEAVDTILARVADTTEQRAKNLTEEQFVNYFCDWNSPFHKVIYPWLFGKNQPTRLERYYSRLGVNNTSNITKILAFATYRQLQGIPMDHGKLVDHFVAVEKKWAVEDEHRATADSLRGVYIPKDLADCFKQLDSMWSDSTKDWARSLQENDFSTRCHFGIGMWMRNNWQLWGGSRLSLYFIQMGVHHPDDMSSIILVSYHRYLSGKEIELDKQVQHYKDFWDKKKK